ncbi:orotate phosphoribosyltransferase, Thermus family, partial [human gut metagenome]
MLRTCDHRHLLSGDQARVIEEAGGVCLGITCVVDRTKPEAPSPIPIVASALKLD